MYKLSYTERFKKAFNRLTNAEQIQFKNKMSLFIENKELIILVDIGHHDILKKF